MPNFVVPLVRAALQNGLLKQETVRMEASKRPHSFYECCPVSVSAPLQSSFFCVNRVREPPEGTSLSSSSRSLICGLATAREEIK